MFLDLDKHWERTDASLDSVERVWFELCFQYYGLNTDNFDFNRDFANHLLQKDTGSTMSENIIFSGHSGIYNLITLTKVSAYNRISTRIWDAAQLLCRLDLRKLTYRDFLIVTKSSLKMARHFYIRTRPHTDPLRSQIVLLGPIRCEYMRCHGFIVPHDYQTNIDSYRQAEMTYLLLREESKLLRK